MVEVVREKARNSKMAPRNIPHDIRNTPHNPMGRAAMQSSQPVTVQLLPWHQAKGRFGPGSADSATETLYHSIIDLGVLYKYGFADSTNLYVLGTSENPYFL